MLGLTAAVLAVLPFAASLGGAFVYDNHALIEDRDAVHSLARLPELWKGEFWQGLAPIHFRYLRPLVSTSYAIDWALHGDTPAGFHATNLLLHAAVAWLLYGALRRWSGPAPAAWGALLATVAWAWHPSKVEVVSWIAGRTDLLCALGILLTCAGVHRRLRGARFGILLEVAGMFVAFASKESAVVVPAFVAVEAWAFFGRGSLGREELLRAARVAWPHAVAVAAYVAARAALLPIVPEGAGRISFIDARLYTLETLGEFAKIVVFPYPLSIQRAPIRVDADLRVLHDRVRLAIGAIAAVTLVIGAARSWKGAVWRKVGWLLGALALAPVANLVPARMVFLFAERFAYVPLVGFALSAVAPRDRWKAWTVAPWALVLGASFVLSVLHTRDFRTDRSLWAHELSVNPKDPLALRFACEEAMRRHDNREAVRLAVLGFDGAAGWPVPRPDRIEFAARAARSLELTTLDKDAATLEEIVAFYRTFFEERGMARLDALRIAVDAGSADAKNFRNDQGRMATMKLWAAIASSRVGQCNLSLPMVRAHLPARSDVPGRVSAALVLARCEAWDEALSVARSLDPRAGGELAANIEWARATATEDHTSLDGALRWSRAETLLLQRGLAYRALVPWEDRLVADRDASVFFARTAFAAGEDAAARRALAAHLGEVEAATLIASWSRELRRE